MDTQTASYLYKETRINFDSALPNSTVILRLPAPGTLVRSGRSSQKRTYESEVKTSDDEKEYKQRQLASAASIYHRQHHKSPRSFLWRVLEDGKALSVSAIDLTKEENGRENPLTLRFIFGSAIRPGCVAISDCKEHDVLMVYALTENNELYTLTLRPDFFRRRAATEDSTSDWCKIYVSSAFTFKHPHRLIAPTAEELLVTLHDGGLLRLHRKPGHDASTWQDTFYNDGGWTSGLKSLVPWQGSNTVKYGKVNMELSAITAIETKEVNGVLCAFTISLDHRLRIWEMAHGKAVFTGDILGQERRPEELGKWVIHPSQSQLIKVVDDEDGNPIVATYSPHGAGEFKFWHTNGIPDNEVELVDMFPDAQLKPPPPTTDIWTMADFAIGKPIGSATAVSLWILWKNNITYRIQTCEFNMLSQSSMENAWKGSWTAAAGETLPDSPLPALTSTDPEDPSQKWLDYIMFPGRYTTATLETALSIYERSVGKADKQITTRTTKNLTERICSIVSSQATLPMSTDGELDFNAFKSTTDAQWRRFYRLIVELDKQRGEALSLGFDHDEQLPIVATADGLSVIRDCSQLERLWHNPDNAWGGTFDAVSRLLSSAAAFRENFSNRLQHACDVQLKVELFQEPSLTDIERLQAFYDKCDFAGQIGDEDFTQLYANLGGSFKGITLKVFQELINSMASASDEMDIDGRHERLPLASFGRKVVVKGVQEMVELHRSICLDQFVLLAFIEGEIDQAEEGMRLDTAAVHRMLMAQLKRLEVLEWLASTTLSIMPMKAERANISDSFTSAANLSDSPNSKKREDTKTVTVLEGTLHHLLGLVAHSDIPAPGLITDLLLRVCDPNSDIELQPALIQAFLIKTERPDLALSFSRFCAQDPFSTYIQGRACLASKDLAAAAVNFKKAAFGLSRPAPHAQDRHSSSLLNDTEWNLLHSGLPAYYSHVVALFDASKAHSYVIDFARLALQFATPVTNAKPIHDQPKDQRSDEIRTDLLSRLFSASLYTSRYDLANSTLGLMRDEALKSNYLRTLIITMAESQSVSSMLSLPWLGLEDAVSAVLSQKSKSVVDVNAGVPWHMILYSWRIRRGDFRGAASVAYERLQKLQVLAEMEGGASARAPAGKMVLRNGQYEWDERRGRDELDSEVTRAYLQVINALACVEGEQAWIFVEPLVGAKKSTLGAEKRRVVRIEELRKALSEEIEREEDLRRGRFAFGADEVSDDAIMRG